MKTKIQIRKLVRNDVTEGGVTILFCWGGVRLLGSGKFGGGGVVTPLHTMDSKPYDIRGMLSRLANWKDRLLRLEQEVKLYKGKIKMSTLQQISQRMLE